MKVLVTGATGFVGREVLRQLHSEGHTARVLARNPKAAADRLPQPSCVVDVHRGDATNLRSLTGAAKGCDAIIHLVGIISEAGASNFENAHVKATRNLVAIAQTDGVKRFIHMSALGTRAKASSRYHATKWEAEKIVRSSGLDFTIFRPSLIYGREDHFVNQFNGIARCSPALPVIGDGESLMQPVSVETVARCFVRSLENPETSGQQYDVCGPERMTFNEVLEAILQASGRRRWKLHIPVSLARAQAALLEWVMGSFLHHPPPLNRDQIIMLQEDNVGDPRPAETMFDLKQESFASGIARYLRPKV